MFPYRALRALSAFRGKLNMAGGKFIPLIAASEKAARDDLLAATKGLDANIAAIDAKIEALERKVDRKIAELIAKREEEG